MLSASAAPRWKRTIRIFPRAPRRSSRANAVRRRKLGLSPRVTSANAPERRNTLRCIERRLRIADCGLRIANERLASLEFRCAQRKADDFSETVQVLRP